MHEAITVSIVVEGRVQGVGYRYFARKQALLLGLEGWVKNLPDGRVEILCSGDKDAVNEFAAVLKKGPYLSSVTSIAVTRVPDNTERDPGFEIVF